MKITEVSADALGVGAVIAAAGKIHDLTEERNIVLGVIEDGGDGPPIAVLKARKQLDDGRGTYPHLAVTIERNPRLLRLEDDVTVEHNPQGSAHIDCTGSCWCIAPCCNDAEGDCTCPECSDVGHDHVRD